MIQFVGKSRAVNVFSEACKEGSNLQDILNYLFISFYTFGYLSLKALLM